MTFIEIIDLFTFYGVDVVVLGIVTCALTQILKTTILKNAPNKVYAFLPVIIGTALYAAYAALAHFSFDYALENAAYLLDKGFAVGACATVIYVICEQFAKGKTPTRPTAQNVVAAIIKGSVDSEKIDTVAKDIADGFDATDKEAATKRIENALCEAVQGDADAQELSALAYILANTLAQIKS